MIPSSTDLQQMPHDALVTYLRTSITGYPGITPGPETSTRANSCRNADVLHGTAA